MAPTHMYELREERIHCPYCGEPLTVLIDESQGDHDYVEDCQVCCRPIEFRVAIDIDGDSYVRVMTDGESY